MSSAYPKPSLKSSVGSKSTTSSSWICRLRLDNVPTFPPAAATAFGDADRGKRTVSTKESRCPSSDINLSVVRHYREVVQRKLQPLRPSAAVGDVDRQVVASFGPFQVRTMKKSGGCCQTGVRGFEKGALRGGSFSSLFGRTACLGGKGELEEPEWRKLRNLDREEHDGSSGKHPSSFSFRFRHQLNADDLATEQEALGINRHRSCKYLDANPFSSSHFNGYFGNCNSESKLQNSHLPVAKISNSLPFFRPWLGTASDIPKKRSKGLKYDASASTTFEDIHNLHAKTMPQQPEVVCRNRSEEPFSFWNLGSFKRTNFVVSSFPSSNLAWNLVRKRKTSADDAPSKYRRMNFND